jgi:hypothetical protein
MCCRSSKAAIKRGALAGRPVSEGKSQSINKPAVGTRNQGLSQHIG